MSVHKIPTDYHKTLVWNFRCKMALNWNFEYQISGTTICVNLSTDFFYTVWLNRDRPGGSADAEHRIGHIARYVSNMPTSPSSGACSFTSKVSDQSLLSIICCVIQSNHTNVEMLAVWNQQNTCTFQNNGVVIMGSSPRFAGVGVRKIISSSHVDGTSIRTWYHNEKIIN